MEQSPSWEANRFSASQETPQNLWNPKVYYRIHKCPPPVLILSSLCPSGFPTKTLYTPLITPIRVTCPVHLILLYFITRKIVGEEYRSRITDIVYSCVSVTCSTCYCLCNTYAMWNHGMYVRMYEYVCTISQSSGTACHYNAYGCTDSFQFKYHQLTSTQA